MKQSHHKHLHIKWTVEPPSLRPRASSSTARMGSAANGGARGTAGPPTVTTSVACDRGQPSCEAPGSPACRAGCGGGPGPYGSPGARRLGPTEGVSRSGGRAVPAYRGAAWQGLGPSGSPPRVTPTRFASAPKFKTGTELKILLGSCFPIRISTGSWRENLPTLSEDPPVIGVLWAPRALLLRRPGRQRPTSGRRRGRRGRLRRACGERRPDGFVVPRADRRATWCSSELGPCHRAAGSLPVHSRAGGGHDQAASGLRAGTGAPLRRSGRAPVPARCWGPPGGVAAPNKWASPPRVAKHAVLPAPAPGRSWPESRGRSARAPTPAGLDRPRAPLAAGHWEPAGQNLTKGLSKSPGSKVKGQAHVWNSYLQTARESRAPKFTLSAVLLFA